MSNQSNDDVPIERMLRQPAEWTPDGGGRWAGPCPIHGDDHQRLMVYRERDGGYRLECSAKCPLPNILEALGLRKEDLRPPHGDGCGLIVRRASDVKVRPVDWLWHHRFVRGAINLIVGMPNQGKSMLTLDIAARVTTGTAWPVGEHGGNAVGSVAILALEDSAETTIVPRLKAAHADLDRVHLVEGVRTAPEQGPAPCAFDIERDVRHLQTLWERDPDLRLVVIDPLDSYIGKAVDTAIGNKVRAALWPMKDWAEQSGVTILLVHHFNKGDSTSAIDRISGSRSFGALPRSVWVVAKDEGNRRLVVPIKLNLVAEPRGMVFELRPSDGNPDVPVVAWLDEEVDANADEVLGGQQTALSQAKDFLRGLLASGPVPAAVVEQRAKEARIPWRTIERAKKPLHVVSEPQKDDSGQTVGWVWRLPEHQTAAHSIGGVGGVGGLASEARNPDRQGRHTAKGPEDRHPNGTAPDVTTEEPLATAAVEAL